MYPYNRNPQKNIASREEHTNNNTKKDLASDKRLLSLLELALQESTQLMERYHHLMTEADVCKPSENIIQSMYLDEKKHCNQLREAYYTITNQPPQMPDKKHAYTATPMTTPKEYLEETLLLEMDGCDFYRNLLLCLDDPDLQNILFEILTDKQNHATACCYLYHKYF